MSLKTKKCSHCDKTNGSSVSDEKLSKVSAGEEGNTWYMGETTTGTFEPGSRLADDWIQGTPFVSRPAEKPTK